MNTKKRPAKKAAQEEAQEEVKEMPEASPGENPQEKETPEEEMPAEAQGAPEPPAKTKRPALERIIVLLDRDVRSTIASFTGASRSSVVRAVLVANADRLSALDRALTEEQIVEALK